ncbi:MAG: F0F1 ATP synthase subunit epsilon [Siphonobacter sp.]
MFVEIITPDKKVFAGDATAASFPSTQGSFQILNNHAPLVSTIAKGDVVLESKEGQQTFTVDGGVVEVLNNKILVLAEAVL